MTKQSYSEKLLDPRWQKKRLDVLNYNDFSCEICGDSASTLHVHHKMYAKGREPWDYELDQYSVLCKTCHSHEHFQEVDLFFEVMSRLNLDGPYNKTDASFLIAGFAGIDVTPVVEMDKFLLEKGREISIQYWDWIKGAKK